MSTSPRPLPVRIIHFAVLLTGMLFLVYGGLPLLTDSFDILQRMSVTLDSHDIDPSRYYYTDVVQVAESERYLDQVLQNHQLVTQK
ncbi:MAG: hypothetical protein IH612_11150 [Desulfofustis sp.]|nr:hypothetical protein [Desulfofustis sp.]